MAAWKARGSGTAGRNLRVRPVPEPELLRMSVEGIGEVSRDGREAEGDGEVVLLRALEGEVVGKTCHERLARGQEVKNREGGAWGRR